MKSSSRLGWNLQERITLGGCHNVNAAPAYEETAIESRISVGGLPLYSQSAPCGSPWQRTTAFPYGQPLVISPGLQGLAVNRFGKLLTVRVNLIKGMVRPAEAALTGRESARGQGHEQESYP